MPLGSAQISPSNIRLGHKFYIGTNTLAYWYESSVTQKKSFITSSLVLHRLAGGRNLDVGLQPKNLRRSSGANVIKLFTAVIHEFS
jgi:hypothetical protein